MSKPTQTIEGWYAFHDFRTIDWKAWRALDPLKRQEILNEWTLLSNEFTKEDAARQSSYGMYTIASQKADLLFIHFRSTLQEIIACKLRFAKTQLNDFLKPSYSYVSIVELSSYLAKPDTNPQEDPQLLPRLHPSLPKHGAVCFYPMNKRRTGNDNWYMLPMKERTDMMRSHGMIGRNYADLVTQIITGSVGFDDWEWGVTLYAEDPLQFKKLIYEMRFDEVSARYGDFGDFYVGQVTSDTDIFTMLTI